MEIPSGKRQKTGEAKQRYLNKSYFLLIVILSFSTTIMGGLEVQIRAMETLWETPESITDYITRQSAGEVSHILRGAQEGKWFDLFKATYTQNWYTEDHFASIALAGIGCSKYWIGIVRKNEGLKAQLVDFFGGVQKELIQLIDDEKEEEA